MCKKEFFSEDFSDFSDFSARAVSLRVKYAVTLTARPDPRIRHTRCVPRRHQRTVPPPARQSCTMTHCRLHDIVVLCRYDPQLVRGSLYLSNVVDHRNEMCSLKRTTVQSGLLATPCPSIGPRCSENNLVCTTFPNPSCFRALDLQWSPSIAVPHIILS